MKTFSYARLCLLLCIFFALEGIAQAQSYTLSFSIPIYTVSEDAGNVRITLRLDRTATEDVSLYFQYTDDTTTINDDYTPRYESSSTEVAMIPAGGTEFSFNIPIIDDTIIENNEFFTITAISSQATANTEVDVIIESNDPLVTIIAKERSVREDEISASFRLRLNAAPTANLRVNVTLREEGSSDYVPDSEERTFEVLFPPRVEMALLGATLVVRNTGQVGRIIMEIAEPTGNNFYFIGTPSSASTRIHPTNSVFIRSKVFLEGPLR